MGLCNSSLFVVRYFVSSFAIISMGKRMLVGELFLSSWCIMIVVLLFLTMPGFVCSLRLCFFLIILTYYFCNVKKEYHK